MSAPGRFIRGKSKAGVSSSYSIQPHPIVLTPVDRLLVPNFPAIITNCPGKIRLWLCGGCSLPRRSAPRSAGKENLSKYSSRVNNTANYQDSRWALSSGAARPPETPTRSTAKWKGRKLGRTNQPISSEQVLWRIQFLAGVS